MSETKSELVSVADEYRAQIQSSSLLLASVSQTLTAVLDQVRAGNLAGLKDIAKKHGELETALGRAHETERKFNEWQRRQSGALADGEIDFDAVRDEIGRRLDRLRDVGGAGGPS